MQFIGRKKELEGLLSLQQKRSSSLVVIKGRRRIGKSRLAEEYAKAFKRSYLLTGVPPEKKVTAQDQRTEFARQLHRQGVKTLNNEDWGDLFTDLALHCKEGQVLVILDEITWMGSQDPTFLPKLKTIWDTHFKSNPQLILLVSGSNSTWIEENLLKSTGFVGRVSHRLHLKELPLHRCNEFWGAQCDSISAFEKFKILSVTGGVPRYLEEMIPKLDAEQNIFSLCYRPTGLLFSEFNHIFCDLFDKRSGVYKEILKSLVQKPLTMKEIADYLGKSKGGDLSTYLEDLESSCFIVREEAWSISQERELRHGRYRLSDNYTRFYLKFVETYKKRIEQEKLTTLPKSWKSIMGLQFENLVLNNSNELIQILGLKSDEIIWSGPFTQQANSRQEGCQIDLLLQTKHRVLYLCEIKFSENPVPFKVIDEAKEKERRLKFSKGFSIRHILIHVNGVSDPVEQADFFSDIVDFSTFLYQT